MKFRIKIEAEIIVDTDEICGIENESDCIDFVMNEFEVQENHIAVDSIDDREDQPCYVDLETVHHNDPTFVEWCEYNCIDTELLQDGPNDWPIVRYSGSFDDLCEMINSQWPDTNHVDDIKIIGQ